MTPGWECQYFFTCLGGVEVGINPCNPPESTGNRINNRTIITITNKTISYYRVDYHYRRHYDLRSKLLVMFLLLMLLLLMLPLLLILLLQLLPPIRFLLKS